MISVGNFSRYPDAVGQRVPDRISRAAGVPEVITKDRVVLVGGMSRSGTTLLTTVLDSHPEISCGAELLPSRIPSLPGALKSLEAAMVATDGDFSRVGRYVRQQGDRELGLFLMRCHRAGVTHEEIRATLEDLAPSFPGGIVLLGERLLLAERAMHQRATREGALTYGFKYTSAATDIALAYFPNSTLLCIVRDPRDVVLSHQKRGFDRSVAEICRTWQVYAKRYREFAALNPERCRVIRYEDLTRQPRRALKSAFEIMPVDLHPEVFDFYRSDSPIHAGFHPNAERLRMNFSTDGIGRGYCELAATELHEIEGACGDEMAAYGYDHKGLVRKFASTRTNLFKIPDAERKKRFAGFSRKRRFSQEDYAELLQPYRENYEILPIGNYVRVPELGERKILMIRHDVDHDLENALRIARWEAERGIRTTYCLLHTAWYYGQLEGGRYRHSDMLVDGIAELSELGHEINLHNNLITLALQEGVDAVSVLKSELDFYDSLGVPVTGTSTHGDALCHQLNYRNWELFSECCDDRFGGPRTLHHVISGKAHTCRLGEQSMFELGLEYEAYDMAKDVYHTESGGRMRVRENTKGRRSFGRSDLSVGRVCGVLTHPIWWEFPKA